MQLDCVRKAQTKQQFQRYLNTWGNNNKLIASHEFERCELYLFTYDLYPDTLK